MNEMDKIKQNLLKTIKVKQSQIFECDINSEEYTTLLNELEVLNLEYKELVNLKGNNYINNMTKFKDLKSRYSFLQTLTMEQILNILANTRLMNKKNNESINIDFTELLTDFKNEILINGLSIDRIKDKESIDKILTILYGKFEDYKNSVDEIYQIFRYFNISNYETLEYAVKNNKRLSVGFLNELKGLGQDSLIEVIIDKYKLKRKVKSDPFITQKKKEEKIETINRKISEYLQVLHKNIGLFIKQNYTEYKDRLGLTIDEYKEQNISKLYKEILYQIAEKTTKIKNIIKEYEYLKEGYMSFLELVTKNLNDIGIETDKLKSEGIDLFTLDKEDIFEILAQINLYSSINFEDKKTKEEGPSLLLKVDEEND